MKRFKKISALVIALALIITVFCSSSYAADTQTGNGGDYLQSVMDLIKQKYNGNITEDELIKAAVKGMFGTLDQYSSFYDPDEFKTVFGSLEGTVEGVGIQVQLEDKYVTVIRTYPGSPAQKAGVLSGDRIAQVNGKSVVGMQLEDVVSKVKGTAGTKVEIGIVRQGVKNIITMNMTRAQVNIPSVKYDIRGDIGYISIETFSANAADGVAEALSYFDGKKITKVVLDLRNNPGGLVDQAVAVAQNFVPKGLITTLDYKDPSVADVPFYSDLSNKKYKLAVLVNGNSASASEILTGAIKDTKAGVVIGTKTFGKAKVQNFTPVLSPEAYERINKDSNNKTVNAMEVPALESDLLGWAKMTVGLYYTPNGSCIDLKGIQPNINVQETSPGGIEVNLLEPLTVTVKPTVGTQFMDVFTAECILKLLKYSVDTSDFTFDKKTYDAVKKFQKDNKLTVSGVLDFPTQKLLNNKLEELKQKIDPVYARAVVELKK